MDGPDAGDPRGDEPGRRPHLAPIRQRIASIFFTRKEILTLERHGARTLARLREQIAQRFLCLAVCAWLNHQLGRLIRSLVTDVARVPGINHRGLPADLIMREEVRPRRQSRADA